MLSENPIHRSGDVVSSTLNRLAEAYVKLGRSGDARKALSESRDLCTTMQDDLTASETLAIIGDLELKEGHPAEALRACGDGLAFAQRLGALDERGMNCYCLYRAHKALGQGMEAVHYLEEYQSTQDSLVSERNAQEVTRRELLYNFNKEQLADSLRHANERAMIAMKADL